MGIPVNCFGFFPKQKLQTACWCLCWDIQVPCWRATVIICPVTLKMLPQKDFSLCTGTKEIRNFIQRHLLSPVSLQWADRRSLTWSFMEMMMELRSGVRQSWTWKVDQIFPQCCQIHLIWLYCVSFYRITTTVSKISIAKYCLLIYINRFRFLSPFLYLHVVSSDAPVFIKPENETIEVASDSDLNLNCSAKGNPPPVYSWNYPQITNENSKQENQPTFARTFHLPGTYSCAASNAQGTKTKYFTVTEPSGELVLLNHQLLFCSV